MPGRSITGMVITPHAVVGALAGHSAGSDLDAALRGTVTHFMFDRVPHADYMLDTWGGLLLVADMLCAVCLVLILAGADRRALIGAISAVAPDAVHVLEQRAGLDVHSTIHSQNHTSVRPAAWVGVLTQAVTVASAGWLLGRAARRPQPAGS